MKISYEWVAGIIEGEGHFSLNERDNSMSVVVSMTDLDVLASLRETTGVGNITGPYSDKRGDHRKPIWRWTTTKREDMVHLCEEIRPFLHERRSAQLDEALSGLKPKGLNRSNANKNKEICKHGHKFTEENTYRRPNGNRSCKTCQRVNRKRYKLEKNNTRSSAKT
jgi:hypothetical protein